MQSKTFNISQSLIKAYNEYLNGELCGLLFEKQYLLREVETEPTELMKLGQFFEYQCTGALPKGGSTPSPEKTQKGELTAPYKVAARQALNFHEYVKKLNIEITSKGKRIVKYGIEGTIDIEAVFQGREVIIDLKYSGAINDKWNDLGWELEALPHKPKLMIQAVHYHYLTGKPFYFWVFSSKNEDESKLIEVVIDPEVIEHHVASINKIRDMIEIDIDLGFKPHPELVRCKYCPLFTSCAHRTEVPTPHTIFYTNH